MAYIIMALDECGDETNCGRFDTESEAYAALRDVHDRYPEYRNFCVELLKDSAYWSNFYAERYAQGFDHPEDIYCDHDDY
jgi:hypothetical protein